MKTLRMLGDKRSEVIEVSDPDPKDDLVVVKVLASAVCGSEHRAYHARPPLKASDRVDGGAGHEGAGIIWKVDGAGRFQEGDHVTIAPMPKGCGGCHACARGDTKHCENLSSNWGRSGTHTQYMLLPESCCLPVPQNMPFDVAALVDDCLATPYRAINRLGVHAGETVLITGAGPIGAAAAIIAQFRNARVIVADVNEHRLELAQKNGAHHVFNPSKEGTLDSIRAIAPGGVDVAIECSGIESAQSLCLDAARANGRVAFLGIKSETIAIRMMSHLVYKELTIIGSWAGTTPEHYEVINLIQAGMPVENLLTDHFGMNEAPKALEKFFGGEALKVVIHPWEQ